MIRYTFRCCTFSMETLSFPGAGAEDKVAYMIYHKGDIIVTTSHGEVFIQKYKTL